MMFYEYLLGLIKWYWCPSVVVKCLKR